MKKAIRSVEDLIEEVQLRFLWWALFVFAVSYFLTHTSKSMWMNLPIAIIFVGALRMLLNEVEFCWKAPKPVRPKTYLSHLEKKQLAVNDTRISAPLPPPKKWKRKIGSPVVEEAMKEFIDKILKDFVVDLWYSDVTPDKEAPEHIRAIVMDALGEVSGRVKEINLVDLLMKDIIDLIGDHIELFRRNQASIGVDVMETLSSEERDERLKHHLMASKELHPALISPESEYKFLQRLMGGVIAVVLRPREAQCPVVRSIARELLINLVIEPVMNFASPGYINELLEYILEIVKDYILKDEIGSQSTSRGVTDMTLAKIENQREASSGYDTFLGDPLQLRPAIWEQGLEAATQRRTEILTPENLENMWAKGKNYKKKDQKRKIAKGSGADSGIPIGNLGRESLADRHDISTGLKATSDVKLIDEKTVEPHFSDAAKKELQFFSEFNRESVSKGEGIVDELNENRDFASNGTKCKLKRSNSTSALNIQPDTKRTSSQGGGSIISEFYSPEFGKQGERRIGKGTPDMVVHSVGQQVPRLRSRVMGAYFEKLGSKSFAVYSIAVTDADNRTWFVKRRYRNFERLHRQLKEIPNYTLHLPPKRIFSSNTEDSFVHQRCIQLDRYLQDLLSIANVAEQHEVWDFLSATSKNYSFGKSPSVMRTLAVNVDEAVDDIVRQFKGVSDGLMRTVTGPSNYEGSSSVPGLNLTWSEGEKSENVTRSSTGETIHGFSDDERAGKAESCNSLGVIHNAHDGGWHSDNELDFKVSSPLIKHSKSLGLEKKDNFVLKCGTGNPLELEDPVGMPLEWTPPNVSVPLLNLVDKVFQLKRRGWLRRQVFWMSKQIVQLMMEDAIDDWLLRQIQLLRRENNVASGIRWLQDVLWPNGTFFLRVGNDNGDQDPHSTTNHFGGSKVGQPASFEQQLKAARRASDLKKLLFDGAPTALVSLVGYNQYRRCARDIYFFTQSNICVKQLAYAILELCLVSVFPELRDIIVDIHEKTHFDQTVVN